MFENVHSISRTRRHIPNLCRLSLTGSRARSVRRVRVTVYVYSFDENHVYEVWRVMSKLCKNVEASV